MYAIIRSGGKQAKVQEGDVIDVERLRGEDEISFTPLLVVDDEGKVFSRRDELASAKVVTRVVGEGAGQKVDIFKYKAKTGYRRSQGHRQTFTTLEITEILPPEGAVKQKAAAKKTEPAKESAPAEKEAAAKTASAKTASAKSASAAKKSTSSAAKKTAAAKTMTKKAASTTKKTTSSAAKKTTSSAAKKTTAKKTTAKKTTSSAAKKTTTKPSTGKGES
jgi:large subunit ribosomal protein L21